MNKLLSKVILGFVMLGIFLAPISGDFKTKKVFADVTNIQISMTQADITPGQMIVHVQITGQPNPGDTFKLALTTAFTTPLNQPFTISGQTATLTIPITLDPNTDYHLKASVLPSGQNSNELTFKGDGSGLTQTLQSNGDLGNTPNVGDIDFDCGLTNFGGCIANFLYVVWEASAWVARGAGHFLDFFIYYSLNDQSYRSDFIDKGWGAIRDIANIFFIISLIYVAIKTILSLNVHNNKKMIGMIIVMALIINFSLFTTKVVIDATNILAKVFYNNITPVDENGKLILDNPQGKSISVGVVGKFNPQGILTSTTYNSRGGTSLFIFLTLILISLTLYLAYMFVSVGVLFVGRVVSLWISMIFSPIAFMSKAVEWDLGRLGFSKWWDDLIKNAFLAPIFIFFLYLIVLFLEILNTGLSFTSTDSAMQMIMSTIIPFAILFILIMKAKDLAVEYAGEMGKAMTKAGSMIGGLAVGAAAGGVAIAGRATLGRVGSAVANNAAVKRFASSNVVGDVFQKSMMKLGSGSMDLRGLKVAGKGLSDTGLTNLGKAKEGGFVKIREERVAKRMKRAKELEVGEDEGLKQELNHAEHSLHELTSTWGGEIEKLDKQIDIARQDLQDAKNADDGSAASKARIANFDTKIKDLRDHKKAIRDGANAVNTYDYASDGARIGAATVKDYSSAKANGRSMDQIEREDIGGIKKKIKLENIERREKYAHYISNGFSKVTDTITGLGQHSWRGADEAAHKIRMEIKLDSGDKGH